MQQPKQQSHSHLQSSAHSITVNAVPCPANTPDRCDIAASGRFCLSCGRTLRSAAPTDACIEQAPIVAVPETPVALNPEVANYWALLMHDIEIQEQRGAVVSSGRFAFYGRSRQS